MTHRKDIKTKGGSLCWDVSKFDNQAPVALFGCHGSQGNQLWKYDEDKLWLVHGTNPRCLDCNIRKKKKTLFVTECDESLKTQKWLLGNVNEKAIAKWQKDGL